MTIQEEIRAIPETEHGLIPSSELPPPKRRRKRGCDHSLACSILPATVGCHSGRSRPRSEPVEAALTVVENSGFGERVILRTRE
jgi:hypothetical protein